MEAHRYIPNYTIADYEMWEGDWELWEGVPVAMTPSPRWSHQDVVKRLMLQLDHQLESDDACPCAVTFDVDWRVSDNTVVRPGIAVLCDHPETDFIEQPPSLIVEVLSPSTAGKDRVEKRRLYADQGVGYYLLADPDARTLEALKLAGGDYQPTDPGSMELHTGCSVSIDADRMWR